MWQSQLDGELGGLFVGGRVLQDRVDEVVEQFAEFRRFDLVGDGLGPGAVLLDQFVGLGEDLRLVEQRPDALDRVRCGRVVRRSMLAGRGDQAEQFRPFAGGKAFERQGQQQRRPGGEHVLPGDQLVVLVAFPVLQVVEDLEGDAQVPAELGDHLLVRLGRPGQPHAGVEGRLERGRRLQRVDLQRIERRQRLVRRVAPEQFGPLAFGELQVGVGQPVEDVGGARRRRAPCARG